MINSSVRLGEALTSELIDWRGFIAPVRVNDGLGLITFITTFNGSNVVGELGIKECLV